MQLDLTQLAFSNVAHVEAKVSAGRLAVTVPRDVAVSVHYEDVVGQVSVEGHDLGGAFDASGVWFSPGYKSSDRRIDLNLDMGAGQILVQVGSSPSPVPNAGNPPQPHGPGVS